MAWFGAAYATDTNASGGNPYTSYDRNAYFGSSDTQAAGQLNGALGGYQDPNAVGAQTQYNAQANALGLANTARGGRGNSMMRSAMLQAPQARQAGMQAQYGQQQANAQNAMAAKDFESQRREAIQAQNLGFQRTDHDQALAQQRSTNNDIAMINGIGQAATGAAMSDERSKVLKSAMKGRGSDSPAVIIMIGCGEHEAGWDDDDEDDDEAGEDAVGAMRELEPATFEYKDEFKGAPGAGDGEYTGIMAQDLEKTPAGRGAVMTGPDGMKRVDGAKLSTLNSAALSQVIKDVDKLKGAKRGR